MKTIVVMPCYNEAERLDVLQFRDYVRGRGDVKLLFVNDGSRDRTCDILEQLRRSNTERALVLELPGNVGKAEAVRQGFLEAFRHQAELIGFWDADLATPLEEIARFQEVLRRRADVQLVVGTRLPLCGRNIRRRWRRHLAGRLFSAAASWVLGQRIYDTQCGAKLFRNSSALNAAFQHPFHSRWIFDVEILARLTCESAGRTTELASAVYELPLDHWEDVAGSRLKSLDFAKAAVELLWIYRAYLMGRRKPAAWSSFRPLDAPAEPTWLLPFPLRDQNAQTTTTVGAAKAA